MERIQWGMGAVSVVSVRSSKGLASPSPVPSAPSLAPQHLSRQEKLKDFVPASGRQRSSWRSGLCFSLCSSFAIGWAAPAAWLGAQEQVLASGRLGICRTVCRWIMRRDEGGKHALPFSGSDTKGQIKKLNEQGWRGGQGGDKEQGDKGTGACMQP